ncbi:hypothetical protein LJR118_003876 [Acidovorax sp. LjRoot118]|uniref:hypothetical protein n=1 Tax=unclassified Acidovorax TaxID=2684926 RepID=UPI00070CB908|nr:MULTISPECIES: hypothetical protein [unclassified Acidovorax]KRC25707.1 hypothetical protein ASE31_19305 [Acidovorax sp. Root217]KRC36333.1 hypothetical protein ASE28_02055 [Acidovorax sp. Root219]
MPAIGLPWPPNLQIDGSTYLVRPLALAAPSNVPERVFIFEEDGSPVLTVRRAWASYPEALYTAEQKLREHLAPTPINVFGG